jgi:hypothetical protein
MKRPQFSIKDLLAMMMLLAASLAWPSLLPAAVGLLLVRCGVDFVFACIAAAVAGALLAQFTTVYG